LALKAGHLLSYICTRSGVSLADPADLAEQLLPWRHEHRPRHSARARRRSAPGSLPVIGYVRRG